MKRTLIMLSIMALALPALADGGYGCNAQVQDCLDKMVAHLSKAGYSGMELVPDEAGALKVAAVQPDSPAARLGVKSGDRINSVNDKLLSEMSAEENQAMQASLTVGSTHKFTVLRHGKEKAFTVTLIPMPKEAIATAIGNHMLKHTDLQIASN